MQPRKIILSAAAVAVLGAIVLLLVQIRTSPAADVPEDELAQALAAHERLKSRAKAPPAVERPQTPPAKRPKVVVRSDEPEPEAKEPAAERPRPRVPGRERPRIARAGAASPKVTVAGRDVGLEGQMDEANGFYDRGDYESARDAALEILEDNPRNVRMLRIVVSTACIMGDPDEAGRYYDRLPAKDQRQMAARCGKYGIDF